MLRKGMNSRIFIFQCIICSVDVVETSRDCNRR